MRKLLRVYTALLKANLSEALEYRAQIFLWLISSIFPLVMMSVWLALLSEAKQIAGWGQADFVSYYVGMILVNHLTGSWLLWDWDDDMRTGGLSTKLLKPIDPFHYHISGQLGWKALLVIFIVPVIVGVAVLSPLVTFPLNFLTSLTFILALIFGFILTTVIACTFAMLGFWSTQVRNVYQLWFGAGQFLSGFIAPLAMFPPAVRSIAYVLPYRGYLGFPLEILTGHLTWPDIEFGLITDIIWITIFFILYRMLWKAGLRRYEAVGA